ncbi:MAG: hypothetical protein K2X82_15680 [Gemmataceae bacterium]|nr:hypothetical protein [Gemmataceae bacterium]
MCCFSGKVDRVADTNIFARAAKDGRQFLVYSMRFRAGDDVAMILPIPTPPDSPEDAVRFINLEKYPAFFDDLRSGFPEPPAARAGGVGAPKALKDDAPLKVVEVGSFEASFVPAVKDFARLDARFRLPDGVWDELPRYKKYGFAVFKLKKGDQKVHPMAFEFPRAVPEVLFFPTVHIHDRTVPVRARFDHALFCQVGTGAAPMSWEESPGLAGSFVKVKDAQGLIDPDGHVYRKPMRGVFENTDVAV